MHISELKVGMLYYIVGTERVFAVLLNQSGAKEMFTLAKWEEVFPLIDALKDALAGPYSSSYKIDLLRKFSFGWGKKLLPPWDVLKAFDALVIIPHHDLYGLPFHVTMVEGDQFLGSTCGVTYCSSGSLFRLCVSRNAARRYDLACWDLLTDKPVNKTAPHFPKSCLSIGTDILHDKDQDYSRLAELFGKFFSEAEVNPTLPRWILKQPNYDAICVICHGHYDELDPDNCGLLLNNLQGWGSCVDRPIMLGNGEVFNFRDLPLKYIPLGVTPRPDCTPEFLTVNELKIDAECRAELVALLGCSTASGSPSSVDDPGTLAEQWLRAGASSVLANFWEIDFDFLSEWIDCFLTNWVTRRQPKAIAWRETIKSILKQNPTLSVFDWGPISVLGDWL